MPLKGCSTYARPGVAPQEGIIGASFTAVALKHDAVPAIWVYLCV